MTSQGEVRVWHADEGWGVIDSADTPGGCWAHFSAVLVPGYRALDAGAVVELTWEARGQDGYAFRAVEVWPAGQAPVRAVHQVWGPSAAYSSTVTLTFDDENETP
jgi:CspA family cold shock protein